jgi:PAS domain S-box-containing protein
VKTEFDPVPEALICAPMGKDAKILLRIAEMEQIPARVCGNLSEVSAALSPTTLLLLLSEEALNRDHVSFLKGILTVREPWSDIPVIVLSSGGAVISLLTAHFVESMTDLATVSIIERPARLPTVRGALKAALSARYRQFQVRDLLHREKESVEELRQLMSKLARSEQAASLLASIVDSSADAIVSKSLEGIITSWNQGAERLFGYTSDEAIGQSITLIIPPDRRDEEPKILNRIRHGEAVEHFETVRLHKEGTPLDISLTISPIRDAAGQIVGASKVARNISDRKRIEEDLRESESRFRELAENLDAEVKARTIELQERNTEVIRQSEELRDLTVRLMAAQDQERRHIARELHDSAGQTLTALGMNLARIAHGVKLLTPELAREAEASQELIQQLNHDIRTTAYLLHPPLLDEAGLPTAIKAYAKGLTDRGGPTVTVEIPDNFERLPTGLELVIFRVVQECLTNVIRHSQSKTAIIRLDCNNNKVEVEVQDSGKGIPRERLKAIQLQGGGVGVRGMRERIRHFGGEMKIISADSGTTVRLSIPIPGNTEAPIGA